MIQDVLGSHKKKEHMGRIGYNRWSTSSYEPVESPVVLLCQSPNHLNCNLIASCLGYRLSSGWTKMTAGVMMHNISQYLLM